MFSTEKFWRRKESVLWCFHLFGFFGWSCGDVAWRKKRQENDSLIESLEKEMKRKIPPTLPSFFFPINQQKLFNNNATKTGASIGGGKSRQIEFSARLSLLYHHPTSVCRAGNNHFMRNDNNTWKQWNHKPKRVNKIALNRISSSFLRQPVDTFHAIIP